MDKVDISLQNIMKEVNTLEEFEKERVVFQVCLYLFSWFIKVSGTTMLAVDDPVSAGTIGYLLQYIVVIQKYKCIEWQDKTGFFFYLTVM